jgi:predicted phage tail protein
LKEKVVALESKVDSLIRVLNEKQTINTLQKQKKKVKNPTPSLANQSVSSNKNNYTWEKPQTSVTPTYKPKKETQLYQVRVGAICCDGSRSYATGRGACSHHGGVCKWLYE